MPRKIRRLYPEMHYPTEEEVQDMIESMPWHISAQYIQRCDCDGFKRESGLTFDSQDLNEEGATKCPCCGKPFKRKDGQPAIESEVSNEVERMPVMHLVKGEKE